MEKVTKFEYIFNRCHFLNKIYWNRYLMKTVLKERLLFILKYLIGLTLLFWILARIDRKQMIDALMDISLTVFLSILVVSFINLAAQFGRWKYLVENHSNSFQTRDLIPSFFAGFAFRLMIPGGHAEITKIFLLPGKKNGKVFAFGIEKFFQTFIKVILILIALPLVFPEIKLYMWGAAALLIGSYFLLPAILKGSFFKRLQEREVNYPRIFLRTLFFSLAVFVCITLQYYILLNEIHTIGIVSTALVVIFILSSGLLPISVSGLGVRENLAVFFLAQYDIPGYTAVGISLLLFFLNAIIPALAGIYYIMIRRKDLKDAKGVIRLMSRRIYTRQTTESMEPLNNPQPGPTVMIQEKTDPQAS